MAACVRCSRENAEYESTFLVVMKDTSGEGGLVSSPDTIATETEHLDGAAVFGICSDCHGKSAKATVRTAAVVMGAMGVLLSVGSHLNVLLVLVIGIGGFLAGGGISYLYCYKFSQRSQALDEILEHIQEAYTVAGEKKDPPVHPRFGGDVQKRIRIPVQKPPSVKGNGRQDLP